MPRGNQPPLCECRMPGSAAGQTLHQAGRQRQAEVMSLRSARSSSSMRTAGGPGVRRCGYGTGNKKADSATAPHCGVLRGVVSDLIMAKCRIYCRQIAAGE